MGGNRSGVEEVLSGLLEDAALMKGDLCAGGGAALQRNHCS